MKIWVDADACPTVIKDILYRAAKRLEIHLILVANQHLNTPASPWIQSVRVKAGFDVADNEIIKQATAGDLVITSDIPLAAEVINKQVYVLTPRGEQYTAENIKDRLVMRDFMETLRSSGMQTGGPPPLNQSDRKAFADQLDTLLTQANAHK